MSFGRLMDTIRSVLALAMLAAVAAFGFPAGAVAEDAAEQQDAAKEDAKKEDAAESDTDADEDAAQETGWREFHYPERGFVVSFPGVTEKPKAESKPVPGQNPLLHHEYTVTAGKDTVYSVVVFEYPEGRAPNPPTNDSFERIVTAFAKGSNTKLRRKTPLRIDERPGYEAKAEDSKGKRNHLITMVANGDRVYMLMSAGPRKHASSEDALRFRDSFRLLGGPPPPETSKKDGEKEG